MCGLPGELVEGEAEPVVRFLAPFDPVVWDRYRFEHLWGWAYRFEAYTPIAKRKLGYYALPLLFGDDVIGWVNVSKKGKGLEVQEGFVKDKPKGRAFKTAFAEEVERMRAFLKEMGRDYTSMGVGFWEGEFLSSCDFATVETSFKSLFQFLNIDWFGEKIVDARANAFIAIFLHRAGSQGGDPGAILHHSLSDDVARGVETIHFGHLDVHQNNVVALAVKSVENFQAIADGIEAVAKTFEHAKSPLFD